MKKLFSIVLALIISTSVYAQDAEVIRLSEPVQESETHEVFGAEVSEWSNAVSLTALISEADKFSSKEVTLETEVAQVCEKKGCFFVASEGENSVRITFKDYGFFIPTDSKGKKVKLVGMFEMKTLSEGQAKHYAEDAGAEPDEIEGEQQEYTIVATSVMVPKS